MKEPSVMWENAVTLMSMDSMSRGPLRDNKAVDQFAAQRTEDIRELTEYLNRYLAQRLNSKLEKTSSLVSLQAVMMAAAVKKLRKRRDEISRLNDELAKEKAKETNETFIKNQLVFARKAIAKLISLNIKLVAEARQSDWNMSSWRLRAILMLVTCCVLVVIQMLMAVVCLS